MSLVAKIKAVRHQPPWEYIAASLVVAQIPGINEVIKKITNVFGAYLSGGNKGARTRWFVSDVKTLIDVQLKFVTFHVKSGIVVPIYLNRGRMPWI